jgi:RHS repeat-associated protein
VAISIPKPATGKHTLYVRTMDKAGNPSTGKAYVFYYGSGVALTQPVENHVTARRVALQMNIDTAQVSTLGAHKYQYRRGAADTWTDVPLADVTTPAGTTRTAWPPTATTTEVSYWDAAKTLAGGGVIEVRALFAGSDGAYTATDVGTEEHTVTVDVNGGQAGDAAAGPGSVNLLTGEFTLSDTDATLFGASIGRSYGSRSLDAGTANGQAGAFGPQWTLTGASEYTDTTWQSVHATSPMSVEVADADGNVVAFTAKSSVATNTAWTPEPGAEDLILTGSTTTPFTLKDSDGNSTGFATTGVDSADADTVVDTWAVASTAPAGTGATARYGYTTVGGKLRLARVAAPNPALTDAQLQTCANPDTVLSLAANRGCRTLVLEWTDPDGTGPVTDRVTSITAWAWNPATSAMASSTEATYGYDSTGRLATVTDPKPGLVAGAHALTTTYGYDSNNLLTTLTPPGELAWTFGYATGTTKAGPAWDRALPTYKGRLVTVSRPILVPGTQGTVQTVNNVPQSATTAVVYGVPTSEGTNGPVDVNQGATTKWGQRVAPVEGTAVFDVDADPQPAGDFWAADDASPRNWGRSTSTFMDVNGRETNHFGRDGLMDATEYDTDGNPVFELTGGNRALALGEGADSAATLAVLGLTGASTDASAQALATITKYEAGTNGAKRVAWTQGPLHTVQTASGTQDQQRATTRNTYNTGRPTDAPTADLVTSSVTGGLAWEADPATVTLDNPRTTSTTYDWTLGQPIAVTTDPSAAAGDEITVRTTYDAKGRVKKQQQPADAAGTSAGTRISTYWDENTGSCTGHAEWGDLVCQTSYAAAITGSTSNTALPVTTTTYNRAGAAASTTETANGATRTTTTTFDAADRPATVTTSNTGLGTNPATQTMAYDPATGALASTTAGGKTITTSTDQLGRQLTYTDGTGLRSSTEYDALGRATKVTESDTATSGYVRTVPLTTTTAYDPATGRQTTQTDTQTGMTTLGYDTAGNITTQAQGAASAGGLKSTSRFDTTGAEVERVWTMTGLTDPVLSESAVENIHGQQVDHTMMPGGHRDYRYDGTGRLTAVTDLDAGSCTTRAYRFDVNSNRTGFTSTSAAATADGNGDLTVCPAPVTPAATVAFDTGDRITSSGHSYDAFGRTTRLPLPGGQVMRVGYHANDLVASQSLYANATDADANNGAGQNATDTSAYTLDVTGQRIATRTAQVADPDTLITSTKTRTLRYAGSGDAPDWTDEGDGTITRNITSPAGDLVATAVINKADSAGANDQLTWQISDLHGDISATLPANSGDAIQVSRPDEYGAGTEDGPRYGWLGAKQRAADTPAGIILMGVRLYNPNTGRFLSPDPVYGGSPNTYSYPTDPVNAYDLNGKWWGQKRFKRFRSWAGSRARSAGRWISRYDYGTAAAGAVNVGWGAAKVYRGVLIFRAMPICALGGWVGAGVCGGFGAYHVSSGGVKMYRGARQLNKFRKTPRCTRCGFRSQAGRFARGVGPTWAGHWADRWGWLP